MFSTGRREIVKVSILKISNREKEVSKLIARGLSNGESGEILHISTLTVKTHLRNIYSKTNIHSRANLAIHVLNSGGL